MPMLLCRLAIMASIIALTASCQTTTKPSPKDASFILVETVAEAKIEWCKGQIPAPFTPEQFDSAPQWVRDYITGNNNQWESGCKT